MGERMKHRARCAVFALCSGLTFGALVQADTVEVTTTDKTGAVTVKAYALQDAGSGVLRLTVPLKDIRADAKYLDVRADFATAKKGDKGCHGAILYNPDKITQNKLDAVNALRLVEFGGRPIFYSATLKNIPDLKAAYEAYKPIRHLQKEFMQSCEFLDKDVARVTYSDGSEIVCNYTDKPVDYRGRKVGPVAYELYGRKERE